MNSKMVWMLVAFITLLTLPWFFPLDTTNKINASIGIATAIAVVVALFSHWFESFFNSPSIIIKIDDSLINEQEKLLWIRGRVLNQGGKTATHCRARITEVQTGTGIHQELDVTNGHLQWQGGYKGTVSLNPDEHLIFDIGNRAKIEDNRPLQIQSYIANNDVQAPLPVGEYILTVKIFGDNFKPRSQRIRLKIKPPAKEIHIEPA